MQKGVAGTVANWRAPFKGGNCYFATAPAALLYFSLEVNGLPNTPPSATSKWKPESQSQSLKSELEIVTIIL